MVDLAIPGEHDWPALAPLYAALLDEPLAPPGVPDWLTRWSDLEKAVWEGRAVLKRARLRAPADAAADQAFQNYAREVMAPSRAANDALVRKLLGIGAYEPAPEHLEMTRRWRAEVALYRPENAPILAAIGALTGEYERITWAARAAAETEPATRTADDRPARERAWRAVQAFWLDRRADVERIVLDLLALRRRLARNAGLPDYRAYQWRALGRLDYAPADVRAHHGAVAAEIVPLAARWLRSRSERLGLGAPRPWDAPTDLDPRTPPCPYDDPSALEDGVARMLARVDPTFGDVFSAMRPEYLHVGGPADKAPINEEFAFTRTGMPCVFVAPRGTFEDVALLLHESGHAIHDALSMARQPLFWNMGGPDEFCELAANGTVMLAAAYLERDRGGFYAPEAAARALSAQFVQWFVTYVPRLTAQDAFQHWVYAEAAEDVRPRDLDARWAEIAAHYLPAEAWAGIEHDRGYAWRQDWSLFTHPFYPLNYNLAQMGAVQIWRHAEADHSAAVRAFRGALALGNTRPLPELYRAAGAALPFNRRAVAAIVRAVAPALQS